MKRTSFVLWMEWAWWKRISFSKKTQFVGKKRFSHPLAHRRKYRMKTNAGFVINLKSSPGAQFLKMEAIQKCYIPNAARNNTEKFVLHAFSRCTSVLSVKLRKKEKWKIKGNKIQIWTKVTRISSPFLQQKSKERKSPCLNKSIYLGYSVQLGSVQENGEEVKRSVQRGCQRWHSNRRKWWSGRNKWKREAKKWRSWNIRQFWCGCRYCLCSYALWRWLLPKLRSVPASFGEDTISVFL